MLDLSADVNGAAEQLPDAPALVELPPAWTEFFSPHGPLPQAFEERRRFPRCYYRGWAVIGIGELRFRVVTKDLSRGGIGFYHHEQLYPLQQAGIWLPGEDATQIRIARCKRIARRCYECGATFLVESDRDAASRQVARSLRKGR